MASADPFFSLVPQSPQAVSIVEANAQFQRHAPDGTKALTFPFNIKSKYQSRMVSFGKASCHDVILPSGRGAGEDYRNDHFFFYMAKDSGELILRDVSGKTALFYPDNLQTEDAYKLHGAPPHRQRVIPKVNPHTRIVLLIGKSALFTFVWQSIGKDRSQNDEVFKQRATSLAVPGATITDPSTPASDVARQISRYSQYHLPSQYTPSVKSTTLCDITFHKYRLLGEGSFGVVHKVVDLRNGSVWALKEIKVHRDPSRYGAPGSAMERKRAHEQAASLKKEVEMIFPLKHVSTTFLELLPLVPVFFILPPLSVTCLN